MLVYYAIAMDMGTIYLNPREQMKRYFEHQHMKELKEVLDDPLHWKYHREIFVGLN
jgi:hypothetical protein